MEDMFNYFLVAWWEISETVSSNRVQQQSDLLYRSNKQLVWFLGRIIVGAWSSSGIACEAVGT
jgi:hypothetical protein